MTASVLKTNQKLIRTNILHKCNRKRSNVSIHCVLKCHNHQRRKKIIIFTTYSTQSVRDSRRPAIYHLMPRPPCSKLTGIRRGAAVLLAYAAAAVRDCLQLLPSSFTLQKKTVSLSSLLPTLSRNYFAFHSHACP